MSPDPVSLRPGLPPAVEAFVRLALACSNVVAVHAVGPLPFIPPGPSPETAAHWAEYDAAVKANNLRAWRLRQARLRLARHG